MCSRVRKGVVQSGSGYTVSRSNSSWVGCGGKKVSASIFAFWSLATTMVSISSRTIFRAGICNLEKSEGLLVRYFLAVYMSFADILSSQLAAGGVDRLLEQVGCDFVFLVDGLLTEVTCVV